MHSSINTPNTPNTPNTINLSRLTLYPETSCFLFNTEPSRALHLSLSNENPAHLKEEIDNLYNWNLFVGEPEVMDSCNSVTLNTYFTKIKSGIYNILENRYFSKFSQKQEFEELPLDKLSPSVHNYIRNKTKSILKSLLV